MKKIKYFALLMLVSVFALTGCSFGKSLSVEDRLEKALINLSKADSFTAKIKYNVEADDNETDVIARIKFAKSKDYYNLYLGADVESDSLDDAMSFEGYLLTSKKSMSLYLNLGDDEWKYISSDYDELEDETSLDFSDYTKGIDESQVKDAIKDFKKIKEGKTKDGITEIIVTIDADDISEYSYGYEIEDDIKVSFFVDKDNNLTAISMDLADYIDEVDEAEFTIEISKVNDTKVKLPEDVEDDAEELDIDELTSYIYGLLMGDTSSYDYDYDDDDDYDYDYDDYDSEEILYDILLSAAVKSCDDGMVVDFKNYNDELILYDDEYDIKRIEDGEITFTKVDGSCDFEVTRPFVIDGKKCTITNKDYYEGKCE